jgi:hypothetical protein
MGEKVKRGIKLEDGSYTYYYDKSPYPGSKSKQEMINANQENKSGMKKKMSVVSRKGGSSKAEKKKMPKARDTAMGNKNIVYLGDPYMVDGEMFDPVKANPEDYLRPEGAKTYSKGSKKPVKAGLGKMVTKLVGKVFGKKSSLASPNNTDLSYQANQSPVIDLYQKATQQKTAKMNVGGEVEVTKGGDYIKDLL